MAISRRDAGAGRLDEFLTDETTLNALRRILQAIRTQIENKGDPVPGSYIDEACGVRTRCEDQPQENLLVLIDKFANLIEPASNP